MSYDKSRLAALLKTIYENTSKAPEDPKGHRSVKILGGAGTKVSFSGPRGSFEGIVPEGCGPTLTVFDDGVDAFNAFVEETLKDDHLREMIGPGAVEQQLNTLLQNTGGDAPDEELSHVVRFQILKPLREGIQPWVSFVPVVNLVVERPLTIANVQFVSRQAAEEESEGFVQEHEFAGEAESQLSQKQAILNQVRSSSRQFTGFARVCVSAHQKRVAGVVADAALIALNVLRAHTSLLYRDSDRALIGLPTELSSGFWQTISLGQDRRHTINVDNEQRGPLIPFVLNDRTIGHLRSNCHFDLIQEILEKPTEDRNSLEVALIQAFQALGRAIVAPTNDLFFLNSTIALERTLIRDREETTTERWSDRLALTLSDHAPQRKAIIERAKKLYDLRSRIVHAAYSGVSRVDARLMEWWAIDVILSTLGRHKDFDSHDAFCRSVDPREIGLERNRKSGQD